MNEQDKKTLATELLKEVKANGKRWFIAFIVTLILWFVTIIGFICYEYYTLPTYEETVSVENDDGNANYIGNDMNGDFNYGKDN